MIESPPLLKIKQKMQRPTKDQIAAFQNVQTGFVVDALFGAGALDGAIQPIGAGIDMLQPVAGPALTADCGPADVLAVFAALQFIKQGDIVVSSFADFQGCAAGGDRLTGMIKNCGAKGFITDGSMRDYIGIVDVGLPVWCKGLTPASPYMSGPGTIGLPIQIGGQQVETGDMIIADRDGVVVVPFAKIDEVIENLERVKQAEIKLDKQVEDGLKIPDHIAELLASDRVKYC